MSAAKATSKKIAEPARGGVPLRLMWLAALAAIAGGVWFGGQALWSTVGPQVLDDPQHRVTPEKISITPLPPWIKTDIKAKVLSGGSLDDNPSALDAGLAKRVSDAFALSPWVERVENVRKLSGGRVEVDLVYRTPVCMVKVEDASPTGGLFPVDINGVLLPTEDIAIEDPRLYPRLAGVPAPTTELVGAVWRDERVTSGARIAAALAPFWVDWKLKNIVVVEPSAAVFGGAEQRAIRFELETQGDRKIMWGAMPADAAEADSVASARVERLKAHLAANGSLDAGTPLALP